MREKYTELEAELLHFEAADVITASSGGSTSGHTETNVIPAQVIGSFF